MFNFTGQTRKRIVNLGDRKPNENKNYVENAKKQRQLREEQRQREKSCLIIQKYFRAHLDLLKYYNQLLEDWPIGFDHMDNELDWYRWLRKASFICKWSALWGRFTTALNIVKDTHEGIVLAIDKFDICFDPDTTDSLLSSFIILLGSVPRIQESSLQISIINDTCDCIEDVVIMHQQKSSKCSIIFEKLVHLLSAKLDVAVKTKITDLALQLKTSASTSQLISFLSLKNLMNFVQKKTARPIFRFSELDDQYISSLNNSQYVNILVNILGFLKNHEPEDADYLFIGKILEQVSFSVEVKNNENDFDLDDPKAVFEEKSNGSVIYVSHSMLKHLEFLYSSKFIDGVFIRLKASQVADQRTNYLGTLSSLMYLIPAYKTKLCIYLTMAPGAYKWFLSYLNHHPIYQFFATEAKTVDFIDSGKLQNIYQALEIGSEKPFWNAVLTFEELLSYWIIISTDFELFSEDYLCKEDAVSFLHFLKIQVLSLIFERNNKGLFGFYEKVKGISISLLNQLHAVSQRLNLVQIEFWSTHSVEFNIDNLIQIILENEETRIDNMDIDFESDEETPLFSGSISQDKLSRKKPIKKAPDTTLAKLEVLKEIPYFVSFKDRVKIFQALIDSDKERNAPRNFFGMTAPRLKADIRREHAFEDAFNSFFQCGSDFKNQISVTLFNNEGGQEAGIDGGGLTKEFLTCAVLDGFSPSNTSHLFNETSQNQLYPNDEIYKKLYIREDLEEQKKRLNKISFLGSLIGKCLNENVLIDVSFAPFFISKWSNYGALKSSINDLKYLDSELFNNLMKITTMSPREVESLDLTFCIDELLDNKKITFDLLPPTGENTPVDYSNRLNYVHEISNFRLNKSLAMQTKYFLKGLYEMIPSNWLAMFDSSELQMLLSGAEVDVDLEDWKANVEYGGYLENDLTVKYFWEVVSEMSTDERFKLIKFVTSVSRAPLLGFGSLTPRFGIRNAGKSLIRLPTASTCVNLLKLPDYESKELLRKKLIYAIHTESRFDLS